MPRPMTPGVGGAGFAGSERVDELSGRQNEAPSWQRSRGGGLLPAGGAQTPAIAGLEAGKLEFRHRRAEVIAAGLGEVQELGSHQHAEGVRAAILSARVAAAV